MTQKVIDAQQSTKITHISTGRTPQLTADKRLATSCYCVSLPLTVVVHVAWRPTAKEIHTHRNYDINK